MANPDVYDERYKKWRIEDLPIIPKEYKYEVTKTTKKQFNILKRLMNSNEVDTIINACDAGREGEAIFRLVYMMANCKKKMKRLWISSMEDSSIKEGFSNLKDGSNYDNLFYSAKARAIADWLVGMNISRLYSCLYNENYSVGRVQTPTLSMIVNRDDEINSFKKEKYYTVEISMNGFTLSTDRIDDKIVAEQLKNLIGEKIEITDVIKKEKITKPNLPFDLTTLQRECNKYFGYSAKQTLDYAQSLYEKKYITYPRTDSRYLTVDMIESTVNNIIAKKKEDIQLPDVKIGDFLYIENKDIKEKYTKPPKHFTEDTLLKAMEIAGNDELVKDVEVEREGLGTPATRAGIIENLIYKGYIKREKKNLISTRKGLNLVTIVIDEFKSPKTTAKWEMRLSDIAKGKEYKENFLKEIEEEIKNTICKYYK